MFGVKRVILVGDEDCGKSSLVTRFLGLPVKEGTKPSLGTNNTFRINVEADGEETELIVRDTNGRNYKCPKYLMTADIIFLCFSINEPDTLKNIATKWSPEMKLLCPKVPLFLVGNKTDLRDSDVPKFRIGMTPEYGQAMMETIGAQSYHECSAKLNEGIEELLKAAAQAPSTPGLHVTWV